MIEIFGLISTVIAVTGVLGNNRRRRWCFMMWLVSNAISAVIHIYSGIWSLALRDVIFFILAAEGWILWGKKILDD
jgi:nicotinamide riboside transporter PnuC